MNHKILLVAGLIAAVVLAGCNKNLKSLDASYFKSTPNPLEAKGGKVDATVTGTFPQKFFSKNAVVTVTPSLKFKNQEDKGAPKVFQGEKVNDNNQTISYQNGGTFTINPSFAYAPEMSKSELYLNFDVTQKNKSYKLPAVKVADGVIATSQLVSVTPKEIESAIAPDNFQRITHENQEADILFLIQQAQLRNTELNKEDVVKFGEKIKEARDAQNKNISSLQVLGYASPDGSVELNTNLAERRQKITSDYINKELKKLKSNVTVDSKFTAEDWDGFQKLMESSDIQDKDLILRVLSMYEDPEQREREIKNLSTTFKDVAEQILPQLRRSRMKLTVDVTGKSDEEISQLVLRDPKNLSPEELLYAASLVKSYRTKADIYSKFIEIYPADVRGYNNLGMIKYNNYEFKDAESLFKKALSVNPKLPDANFNMGLMSLTKGQVTDGLAYFGKSAGTTGNLNAALGATYIMQGDYVKAQDVLKNVNSNNAMLAQILNSDYNTARKTLTAIQNPDATTAYLAALIAARTNDRDAVYSYLNTAVKLDSNITRKIVNDIEFAKYLTDPEFLKLSK